MIVFICRVLIWRVSVVCLHVGRPYYRYRLLPVNTLNSCLKWLLNICIARNISIQHPQIWFRPNVEIIYLKKHLYKIFTIPIPRMGCFAERDISSSVKVLFKICYYSHWGLIPRGALRLQHVTRHTRYSVEWSDESGLYIRWRVIPFCTNAKMLLKVNVIFLKFTWNAISSIYSSKIISKLGSY